MSLLSMVISSYFIYTVTSFIVARFIFFSLRQYDIKGPIVDIPMEILLDPSVGYDVKDKIEETNSIRRSISGSWIRATFMFGLWSAILAFSLAEDAMPSWTAAPFALPGGYALAVAVYNVRKRLRGNVPARSGTSRMQPWADRGRYRDTALDPFAPYAGRGEECGSRVELVPGEEQCSGDLRSQSANPVSSLKDLDQRLPHFSDMSAFHDNWEGMNHVRDTSDKRPPLPIASYCVTLIDANLNATVEIENALRRTFGSVQVRRRSQRSSSGTTTSPQAPRNLWDLVEIRREKSVAAVSYPLKQVHAIVLSQERASNLTEAEKAVIRSATSPATCRAYVAPSWEAQSAGKIPFDSYVQRGAAEDASILAGEILEFFAEADKLNRHWTRCAVRDAICLPAFGVLQILWPPSYAAAALHVSNAVAALVGYGLWLKEFSNPFLMSILTFFGVFFVVHCLFAAARNVLFAVRILHPPRLSFLPSTSLVGVVVATVAWSIAATDGSSLRVLASTVLAVGAYNFYLYARRLQSECNSLPEIAKDMANSDLRTGMLQSARKWGLGPSHLPFFPYRSKKLFISYMRRSAWSSETAESIHEWAKANGYDVFWDRFSIAPGVLWQKYLLRACGECAWFIAVLDHEAPETEWVLAESWHAAAQRKNVGKPNILLVVRDADGRQKLRSTPYGYIYWDVLEPCPSLRIGAGILSCDGGKLSKERISQVLNEVRPMCLLQ
jgi:hypothetical protein